MSVPVYQDFLEELVQEFTYAFGGCTVVRGVEGSYLSERGVIVQDRINLVFTDASFSLEEGFVILSRFSDQLHEAAQRALHDEEAILVAILPVFHAV